MTCLGVLERGERGDDNGTSLKVRGGIEMSTTVLHSRAAPSLKYSPMQSYLLCVKLLKLNFFDEYV